MSSTEFFQELRLFNGRLTEELSELRQLISSPQRPEVSFQRYLEFQMDQLSTQTDRLCSCIGVDSISSSQDSSVSLQQLLSICQIILDENEILLDDCDILQNQEENGPYSRGAIYDNALNQFRNTSSNEQNNNVHVDHVARLNAFLDNRLPAPVSLDLIDMESEQENNQQTLKRRRVEDEISSESQKEESGAATDTPDGLPAQKKQRLSLTSTPTLENMGLSTSSLQTISSLNANIEDDDTEDSININKPFFRKSQSLQNHVVNSHNSLGLLPVTQAELDTLPFYLINHIDSLASLNNYIEQLNLSGMSGVNEDSIANLFPEMSANKVRSFLLILLKLKRLNGARRDENNMLIYL